MFEYLNKQLNIKDNIIAYNTTKANELYSIIGANFPQTNELICFDNSIAYTTTNVKYPEKNKPRPVQCAATTIPAGLKQP